MTVTHSIQETSALAKKMAATLRPKDILALEGELGAGKTSFVQGLAMALGVAKENYVRSPSFTLMNEYDGGKFPIFHFDFYRLHNASELDDLGLEEYFDGEGITIIEWADKFRSSIPKKAVWVKFKIINENEREISYVNL